MIDYNNHKITNKKGNRHMKNVTQKIEKSIAGTITIRQTFS